jgi:hypothetical protein
MPTKVHGENFILNVFSFLYTALLLVAFALSTYRNLLDSGYVWYILSGLFLPTTTAIAEGDAILPTVFFTGLCALLDLAILIVILIGWIQQGSFYLNLMGSTGALWVLVLDLAAMIIVSGLLIYFLLKVRKQANKYL